MRKSSDCVELLRSRTMLKASSHLPRRCCAVESSLEGVSLLSLFVARFVTVVIWRQRAIFGNGCAHTACIYVCIRVCTHVGMYIRMNVEPCMYV